MEREEYISQGIDKKKIILLTYDDVQSAFDDFLDETHGAVIVAGQGYHVANALRKVDPDRYWIELGHYVDTREDLEEFGNNYVLTEQVEAYIASRKK